MIELVIDKIAEVVAERGLPCGGRVGHRASVARSLGTHIHFDLIIDIRAQFGFFDISLFEPLLAHSHRNGGKIGIIVKAPRLVALDMYRLIGVHARQQHHQTRSILILVVVASLNVAVGGIGRCFDLLGVGHFAIIHGSTVVVAQAADDIGLRQAVIAYARIFDCYGSALSIRHFLLLPSNLLGPSLSVEQRRVAILLAVEVGRQSKDVVRRILVHRGVGAGAYQQ